MTGTFAQIKARTVQAIRTTLEETFIRLIKDEKGIYKKLYESQFLESDFLLVQERFYSSVPQRFHTAVHQECAESGSGNQGQDTFFKTAGQNQCFDLIGGNSCFGGFQNTGNKLRHQMQDDFEADRCFFAFDQFKNFMVRGNFFKKLVMEL